MGMYCCCGVKIAYGWICKCDWDGWYLCYEPEGIDIHSIPISVKIKEKPDKEGVYQVRIFEDGDHNETQSNFCPIKKNWGQETNQAISHWEITYYDGWIGCRDVYAWKELTPESPE